MRKWISIVAAVMMALSCSREAEQDRGVVDSEGKVEITFSVAGDGLATKSLGEAPQLETMHVAVFGGSGYLKEYVPATLESTGEYKYEFFDAAHNKKEKMVPEYTFKVSITLSNSSRRVHFIGNGPESIPFGRDYEVLPSLLGEKETGFWQMIQLDHISAMQDSQGNYLTPDGNGGYRERNPGEPYAPSEALQNAFRHIPLIRNWAKIVLQSAPVESSNFVPISFAVANVPSRGSLVPYGGVKGFITNYKDLSFEDLRGEEYDYGGNLPSSVTFDSSVPSASHFENFTGGVKRYDVDEEAHVDDEDYAVYLYERPIPDANIPPSYVIVYGRYKNPDDTSLTDEEKESGVLCYYKVDLMSGNEYYPVLRNFKYLVKIDKISARGHKTPEEAAAAAGSADVSADINASTLPDISDGTRRMAIQPWMSKTFIHAEEKKEQLYVAYYDDINGENAQPNLSAASVKYELIPENAGIIKDVEIGEAVADASKTNYGWRPISFAIASPDQAAGRTQTLRILCKTEPDNVDESPLYRDVVISLMPTQHMRVSCNTPLVLLVAGESQRIDVDIPDGLVESMFPLNFIIEAKNLTLTPDNTVEGNSLPVISETSIVGDYPTFHYQRTLEWSEYKELSATLDYEDDSRWRTFHSYFKTNCEISATEIYVANEYFYTAQTSFSNFASFRDPGFTTPIPRETGGPVGVSAKLMIDKEPYVPMYLDLQGLVPAEGSSLEQDPVTGLYAYTPTSGTMDFQFKTTVDDGNVRVTLLSEDDSYEPAVLTPWHFREAKVMDMATPNGTTHTGGQYANVVVGHVNSLFDKRLVVGYFTDAAAPRPQTTIKDLYGVFSDDSKTTWADTGPLSATAQTLYREKWMRTNAGMDPVSMTLSAVGYVEEVITAPRFKGAIYSYDLRSSNDWNSLINNNNLDTREDDDVYDYRFQKQLSVSEYPEKGTLSMEVTGNKPIQAHSASGGIVLISGGHYEIEVNIGSDHGDIFLFYNQLFYYTDSGTPLKPRSVDPHPDGSIYYGYQGNNYEYIWSLPYGDTGGKLVIDAPAGQDVVLTRLIMRGFHGILNSTSDTGGGDVDLGGGLNDGGSL